MITEEEPDPENPANVILAAAIVILMFLAVFAWKSGFRERSVPAAAQKTQAESAATHSR
jgi:hypothetical protein